MLKETFKLDVHVECPAALLVLLGLLLGSATPAVLNILEPLFV